MISWSIHMEAKVNDQFLVWLNKKYGGYGAVKATRGKRHDYLSMTTLDFTTDGTVVVDMCCDYVANMLVDCLMDLGVKDTSPTPALENLFETGQGAPLDRHTTIVAKGLLFLYKRGRPDVHLAIAYPCTRE